ncbi:signal peptidase I [Arthrobacter sp. AFG7.2]|uniref:Ig-like domain-containing protein n=1 Tax=Arthrobacter sp. AFG7.2 TaxID=1688693 RepID=UPI000C9EAE6C|nr:Ig-like domain-containing protein [Arthrobacter sp. AFG7.2]PNI10497.1 signal peptidase I [Arthrobacter sp. AFG7.2]
MFSADGWPLFFASLASRLYLGVLLSLSLFAVLPVLFGWHGTVVQSGSMEPHISPGDMVLAARLDPSQPVPVGGVVEYRSPASAEPGGVEKIRLHRIVAANTDGTFVTAGDANTSVDSTPLDRGQITGQARLLVPSIGLPGLWLGTGKFPALAFWSVLTLLAVVAALFGWAPKEPSAAGAGDGNDGGDGDPGSDDGGTPPLLRAGTAAGIVAALTTLVIAGAGAFSAAAFTATTASAANTFSAAPDWTPPSVTLANPGPTLRGATVVTAEANDAETGVRSVTVEYAAAGSNTWVALCTVTTAPYSCPWNTPGVPDGQYTLRASATDNAGLTATSATVSTTVANTFSVVLNDPGEVVRGTTTLSASLYSPGTSTYSVRVEYSLAGTNRWSTLCSNLAAPYNCAWNTAQFANDFYDLRAVAVSGTVTRYSETVTDVLVDNGAPAVTLTDPGTALRGTTTFAAAASDPHSGVANVQFQYLRSGTSTWIPLCTVEESPYSCRFDTTTIANGTYSFRAVATDEAGNSAVSTVAASRTVDNTVASVSVEDPGAYLTGTVALKAAANSTAGIAKVEIQTAPAGAATWTTRCTLAAAPFSCTWDTTAAADGLYDFRAVLTDAAGRVTVSATVSSRRVDNSPLRGVDIQADNRSGVAGKLDAGDVLAFTYSQPIDPASVVPGWTGAALPVTVRLRDGNLLGLGNSGDTVDVLRNGSAVNLGAVNTRGNFVKNRSATSINATMSAATVTIAGVPRTVVTVTLGSAASGANNLRIFGTAATMVWSPTAAVTSPAGVATSTAPVTETGALDRDF